MKSFTLTVFAGLLLLVNCAFGQKNLVTNGGFEDDDLYGWNNYSNTATQTPWNFKSGKKSCAIITTNADNWVGIDQIVRIPKKTQAIEFDAWIKTTNVLKGKNDWNGAIFTIVFLDGADKEMGSGTNVANLTGSNDWALYKKSIRIPDKAVSFKILLVMGNASGAMLVDDVSATVVN